MNDKLTNGVYYDEGYTDEERSMTIDHLSLHACNLIYDYSKPITSPITGELMDEMEKLKFIMINILSKIDNEYLLIPRDGQPKSRIHPTYHLPYNINKYNISGELHEYVKGYMGLKDYSDDQLNML